MEELPWLPFLRHHNRLILISTVFFNLSTIIIVRHYHRHHRHRHYTYDGCGDEKDDKTETLKSLYFHHSYKSSMCLQVHGHYIYNASSLAVSGSFAALLGPYENQECQKY